MSKLKPAVYQVSECGGFARLICVLVQTLEDGLKTEELLRERFGRHSQVTFLGRFDCIEVRDGVAPFLDISSTEEEGSEELEAAPIGVKIPAMKPGREERRGPRLVGLHP